MVMTYYITEQWFHGSKPLHDEIAHDMFYDSHAEAFRAMVQAAKDAFLKQHSLGKDVHYVAMGNKNTQRILEVLEPDTLKKSEVIYTIHNQEWDDEEAEYPYLAIWGEGYVREKRELSAKKCRFGYFNQGNGYSTKHRIRIANLKSGESCFISDDGSEHWVLKV